MVRGMRLSLLVLFKVFMDGGSGAPPLPPFPISMVLPCLLKWEEYEGAADEDVPPALAPPMTRPEEPVVRRSESPRGNITPEVSTSPEDAHVGDRARCRRNVVIGTSITFWLAVRGDRGDGRGEWEVDTPGRTLLVMVDLTFALAPAAIAVLPTAPRWAVGEGLY